MAYSLDLFELSLARSFAPPKFEVGANVGRILQSLHDSLSSQFPVRLSDLSALPGATMATIGARMTMYDGQVSIEVTPERLAINARGLRTATDLDVARRVAILTEQTISSLFSDIKSGEATLSMFGWMKRNGDSDPLAKEILGKVQPTTRFATSKGESTVYPIRMRLQSDTEAYSCDLVCDEAAVPNTQVFISFTLKLGAASPHKETEQVTALGESILRRWLEYLAIPVDQQSQAAS